MLSSRRISGFSPVSQLRRLRVSRGRHNRASAAGITLLELLVASSILILLATVAMPMTRVTVIRKRELLLHYRLRQVRDAIDRYQDDASKGLFQVAAGTENYPPDLETLYNGVQLTSAQQNTRLRFLRDRDLLVDPMTGGDWGLRSVQDDPDTTSWGGQDVFDVYSKSTGTALDGTRYADW
jgi:general secretion pathway protein G